MRKRPRYIRLGRLPRRIRKYYKMTILHHSVPYTRMVVDAHGLIREERCCRTPIPNAIWRFWQVWGQDHAKCIT